MKSRRSYITAAMWPETFHRNRLPKTRQRFNSHTTQTPLTGLIWSLDNCEANYSSQNVDCAISVNPQQCNDVANKDQDKHFDIIEA